ncbi:MAG: hypothetical protein KGL74_02820, partial [Elusimicrobia bacterium]|nr:hypothetical protein [Elusimicrobiota bacterium]
AAAEADFAAAWKAASAPARTRPAGGLVALRAEFDAAVERGWLQAAILEARMGFHERAGRADRARADRELLDDLEVDRDAARGLPPGAAR